jgi:hypothetical protein
VRYTTVRVGPAGSKCRALMSDSTLARLVVTVIVLIGFALWLKTERDASRGCGADCPTDISASRR